MKRKIHLKKRNKFNLKKVPKINIIIILIVTIMIAIFLLFRFINKKVSPVIMNYAELQAGKIATYIIRQAVNEEVTKEINVDELFITTKDDNGNIKTIDFNPLSVNRLLSKITETVNEYLTNLESTEFDKIELPMSISSSFSKEKKGRGLVFEIPSGVVFKNSLLTNIGPKIPVKLTLIGDIDSDIKTKVTNYGINNALIKVNVYVHVVEQVILPISSKKVDVEMNIPLAVKLIQGQIPEYYLNGKTDTSLTVPVK